MSEIPTVYEHVRAGGDRRGTARLVMPRIEPARTAGQVREGGPGPNSVSSEVMGARPADAET